MALEISAGQLTIVSKKSRPANKLCSLTFALNRTLIIDFAINLFKTLFSYIKNVNSFL